MCAADGGNFPNPSARSCRIRVALTAGAVLARAPLAPKNEDVTLGLNSGHQWCMPLRRPIWLPHANCARPLEVPSQPPVSPLPPTAPDGLVAFKALPSAARSSACRAFVSADPRSTYTWEHGHRPHNTICRDTCRNPHGCACTAVGVNVRAGLRLGAHPEHSSDVVDGIAGSCRVRVHLTRHACRSGWWVTVVHRQAVISPDIGTHVR